MGHSEANTKSNELKAVLHPEFLSVIIRDKAGLYEAYMPFVKQGGLFIPTNKCYHLGDQLFVLLTLMEEREKFTVSGKVVWITPKGAQGNRPAGIGVQFQEEEGAKVCNKIRAYLVDPLKSDRSTYTM